jgi:hypothetical protein
LAAHVMPHVNIPYANARPGNAWIAVALVGIHLDMLNRFHPRMLTCCDVADFPQLSLADVHAALACYFDHREEIQRQAKEDEEFVAEMKRKQGATKYDLLKQRLGLEDAISSG